MLHFEPMGLAGTECNVGCELGKGADAAEAGALGAGRPFPGVGSGASQGLALTPQKPQAWPSLSLWSGVFSPGEIHVIHTEPPPGPPQQR